MFYCHPFEEVGMMLVGFNKLYNLAYTLFTEVLKYIYSLFLFSRRIVIQVIPSHDLTPNSDTND